MSARASELHTERTKQSITRFSVIARYSRAKEEVFTELWDNYLMNINLILQSQKKYPGTQPGNSNVCISLLLEVAHNIATPGLDRHVIICCAYDSAWQVAKTERFVEGQHHSLAAEESRAEFVPSNSDLIQLMDLRDSNEDALLPGLTTLEA